VEAAETYVQGGIGMDTVSTLEWTILSISLCFAALMPSGAQTPQKFWHLDQEIQGGYPGGLQFSSKLFYRMPLSESTEALWKSTKIDLGLANALSPAFDFLGAFIDIEPIAFFDIALSAQAQGYFKTLGYGFHDMAGYQSAFDTSTLAHLPSKNTLGYCLSAAPTIKFALGHIVAADTFGISYFDVDGGLGYFYEAEANCILAKKGVEFTNQAYLLFAVINGLMVGFNDSLLNVPSSGYESQTVHVVTIFNSTIEKEMSLYFALLTGLYVEDRYFDRQIHLAGTVGIALSL
jgi:hypothetical protein